MKNDITYKYYKEQLLDNISEAEKQVLISMKQNQKNLSDIQKKILKQTISDMNN